MSDFMAILNPVAKWLHIIAGVMWIGLLYFFNFINGHVAATMDGDTKKKVVPELFESKKKKSMKGARNLPFGVYQSLKRMEKEAQFKGG